VWSPVCEEKALMTGRVEVIMPLTEEIYSSRKDLVWTDETFYFVYICQIAM
jgi:hypothetical protein